MDEPNAMGALVDDALLLEAISAGLKEIRALFNEQWPPANDIIPMRTSNAARWYVESEAWWRARARMEEELWAFAVQAPSMDYEVFMIKVDALMGQIRSTANNAMAGLIITRAAPEES